MNTLHGNHAAPATGAAQARADRIVPGFFGAAQGQLYGCHHPPAEAARPPRALVLCPPALHEYESTHRALRQLAIQAARRGFHAFRFDYYATADSAGACGEATLERWRDDVIAAIDECRRRSGAAQTCLFGLRLGATLALEAAAVRDDVDALVLHAPILDGPALLDEWGAAPAPRDGPASEIGGFELPAPLHRALAALGPRGPDARARRALLIDPPAAAGLAEQLRAGGAQVTVEDADAGPIWRADPMRAMVPIRLLRRIVAWLEDGA